MSEEKIKQIVREAIGAYAEGDAVLWINAADVNAIADKVATSILDGDKVFVQCNGICDGCDFHYFKYNEETDDYDEWCGDHDKSCGVMKIGYYR